MCEAHCEQCEHSMISGPHSNATVTFFIVNRPGVMGGYWGFGGLNEERPKLPNPPKPPGDLGDLGDKSKKSN